MTNENPTASCITIFLLSTSMLHSYCTYYMYSIPTACAANTAEEMKHRRSTPSSWRHSCGSVVPQQPLRTLLVLSSITLSNVPSPLLNGYRSSVPRTRGTSSPTSDSIRAEPPVPRPPVMNPTIQAPTPTPNPTPIPTGGNQPTRPASPAQPEKYPSISTSNYLR